MRVRFAFLSCLILTACSSAIRPLAVPGESYDAVRPIVPARAAYKSIFSFGGTAGAVPYAGLVGVKGTLYGTTSTGGTGPGVVFKITPQGAEQAIYSFTGGNDGGVPIASLKYSNGFLYGTTTVGGGSANCGTVFRMTLGGAIKTLHSFKNNADGCTPEAPLLDVKGTFYGTTHDGGKQNGVGDGTVFKITTSGSEKVLYAFKGSRYNDAGTPVAGVTNLNGVLYGTTDGGGPKQDGTVYKVTLSGAEKVLHIFTGKDGNSPLSRLCLVNGIFYGTTSSGGAKNLGTVFAVGKAGVLKVLHSFRGADGAMPPLGGLVYYKGAIYGVTSAGGAKNAGTIFRMTLAGKETVLYSFGGGYDGVSPSGTLASVNGVLFGTTSGGGTNGKGTVYAMRP